VEGAGRGVGRGSARVVEQKGWGGESVNGGGIRGWGETEGMGVVEEGRRGWGGVGGKVVACGRGVERVEEGGFGREAKEEEGVERERKGKQVGELEGGSGGEESEGMKAVWGRARGKLVKKGGEAVWDGEGWAGRRGGRWSVTRGGVEGGGRGVGVNRGVGQGRGASGGCGWILIIAKQRLRVEC